MLATLQRIEKRLDRLEVRVEQAASFVDAAPGAIATAANMLDQWAAEKGDVDERLRRSLSLLDRLSEPQTLARLEAAVELVDQLPGQLATMGDVADSVLSRIPDIDERLRASVSLLEKASEPATLRRLEEGLKLAEAIPGQLATMGDVADSVLSRIPDVDERLRASVSLLEAITEPAMLAQLRSALELLREAPGVAATTLDMVDGWADRAEAHGIDLKYLIESFLQLGERTVQLVTSPQLEALLDSAALRPEALESVAFMADALEELHAGPKQRVGALGLLRALRDPDIQRTLGFALAFARTVGGALDPQAARKQLS